MNRGELRKEILENCPDEFDEELNVFISKVEGLVDDILSSLVINDISELYKIEEAYELADNLHDGLY